MLDIDVQHLTAATQYPLPIHSQCKHAGLWAMKGGRLLRDSWVHKNKKPLTSCASEKCPRDTATPPLTHSESAAIKYADKWRVSKFIHTRLSLMTRGKSEHKTTAGASGTAAMHDG